MISQISCTHPLLQQFVSQYLYMTTTFVSWVQAPCVPRGLCAMMFPLQKLNSQTICTKVENNTQFSHDEVYLFGQATEVQWVKAIGKIEVLYVVLKPMALHQLMREQASFFTDKVIKLSEWFPQTNLLTEQLSKLQTISDKITIINRFLFTLFKSVSIGADALNDSLFAIFQAHGKLTMQDLARKERVSVRTLQRKFDEHVGMSPYAYARIIRFRTLMQYLLTHPETTLLDLACMFSYHDHSHLIKDFHHFTGNTPNFYLKQEILTDRDFLKYL